MKEQRDGELPSTIPYPMVSKQSTSVIMESHWTNNDNEKNTTFLQHKE